ncbi:MAG: esterase-like activity of phytase family protein [Geodermatophilaceae bacterium]|nr:esterase-like activity of phytase family protein [Geodermatophilaceae bacterium]
MVSAAALGVALVVATSALPGHAAAAPEPAFIGSASYPTGLVFQGTEVGGLSGLTYDDTRGVYYAISDDRSERAPARFYTLRIDLTDGSLTRPDVRIVAVTTLLGPDGLPFPALSVDPEGIALSADDTLVITSEGDAANLVDPFVREFALDGRQLAELPVPVYYDPVDGGAVGIRTNLAFESAGFTVDRTQFFTGTENALAQDGPTATLTSGSPSRLLRYDAATQELLAEYVYVTDAIPQTPVPPDAFATNGLVDLLPLDATRLIAVERAFSTGVGNSIRLYSVDLSAATDVEGVPSLRRGTPVGQPARKKLLLDLDVLGLSLDNVEGITYGPLLPDGGRSVILVADNNFSPTQVTQFIALSV